MTEEQLLDLFAKRAAKDLTLTWGDFTSAVTALPIAERNQLLAVINTGNEQNIGSAIATIARNKKQATARAQVDAIAVSGHFTIAQLLNLLS